MAKSLITNYTFNKAAKTVTFTDFATLRLDSILLITDVTNNTIIYNFADSTLGGTVSTNVLTLTKDTTGGSFNNADKLMIYYDMAVSPDVTLQAAATGTGNGSNLTITGYSGVAVQISGTHSATLTFEVSMDAGITWSGVFGRQVNSDAWGLTAGNNGLYHIPVGAADLFRARVSAFGGTSVTVVGRGFNSNYPSVQRLATGSAIAATQSGTWTIGSSTATGSAVPANALYNGTQAITSLPTAATNGNLVGMSADKFGRLITTPLRDLISSTSTTITASTAETTIVASVASTFNDIQTIDVVNTSTSTVRLDIRSTTGGSIRRTLIVPPTDMRGIAYPLMLPALAVNVNWTAQCDVSATDLRISVSYMANK